MIIFERSWHLGEVPEEWKKATVTPIFKKGKEEDPGNYNLGSLTLTSEKVMENIIMEAISKHVKAMKAVGVFSMDL